MNESPCCPPPSDSSLDAVPKVTPSAGWYLLSAMFLLAGLITAGVLVKNTVDTYETVAKSIQYLPAPGLEKIHLEKSGMYSLYQAFPIQDDGKLYVPDSISITVKAADQEEPLELLPPDANQSSFEVKQKKLLCLHRFKMPKPGDVTIISEPAKGHEDTFTPMEIGIGPNISLADAMNLYFRVLFALIAGVAGFIFSLLIFIVTIIRRSANKGRMRIMAEALYEQSMTQPKE